MRTISPGQSRRRAAMLRTAGTLAAASVALAACGSGGGAGPQPSATPTAGTGTGAPASAPATAAADPFPTAAAVTAQRPVECPAGGTTVSNAGDLRSALSAAKPGAVIRMTDGTYGGDFRLAASGTEAAPIWLCGSPKAVLDGEDDADYVLHLDGASWVRVVGFTVRNGQKGVMADRVQHSIIAQLQVNTIGDEAIHLRTASSDNQVIGNVIRDTGNRREKFGEGVYVGSASSNWCKYTDCGPDRSDRNSVIGNDIAGTTSENIDIKEGTTGGVISGNTLSSDALTEADSWIDIKGNGWLIEDNTGIGGGALEDGFQTHVEQKDWGRQNTFRRNRLPVNAKGYGIYIHEGAETENIVSCDNQVSGASSGPSNIDCSSA
nr:hypothetical protein [Parafrankia discariae]